MEEITMTARRLLVEQGSEAASLRAIAREMGMTAPALYRYYGSREDLIRHVCADIFRELDADVRRAIEEAAPPPPVEAPPVEALPSEALPVEALPSEALPVEALSSEALPAGQDTPSDGVPSHDEERARLARKMVAACQEFRRWSLSHRGEFGLLFGVPVPGLDGGGHDIAEQCALEFAATFYVLFLELWAVSPFPVLPAEEIDPALRPQLARFREKLAADVPDGAILVFLRCWVLLYGAVAMEVFGHLDFALDDPVPMFDLTLGDLATMVGLRYRPVRPPH
jgi:AcrR family transcriptional regulator